MQKVRVWDLPTRLFHWTLVGLFAALWLSVENGQIELHTRLGVAMLVLLLFRVVWGFCGSQTARFSDFVRGPADIRRHLAGHASESAQPGHNPLGGLMVLALLLALLIQVGLGLFAADVDTYTYHGPLVGWLGDDELAEIITGWHGAWFNVLLGLCLVHILAIAAYRRFKGSNLVKPMITGWKMLPPPVKPLLFVPAYRALGILLGLAVVVWFTLIGR